MPNNQPTPFDLLVLLFIMGVELLCLVFFPLMTGLSWRLIRYTWKRGVLLGAGISLLWLPMFIVGVATIDFSSQRQDLPESMDPVVRIIAGVVLGCILVLLIPLRATYYHVAKSEWARIRGTLELSLAGPPRTRLLGIGVGIGVGLANLVITLIVFHIFKVEEPADPEFLKMFPSVEQMSYAQLALPVAGFAIAAAIVEELIFRGGILGFFLRITKNRTGPAWVFIVATALLWALLHIPNTDHPFLKVMQIFTLGIALGWMMRQWGLASTMAAHIALNAGAVISQFFIPE